MTNTERVSGLVFGWALGFLLAALNSGCAPSPPRTITVSPELPEGIQVAAARARDAWCAAPVGWCPELAEEGGDAKIVVAHWRTEMKATDHDTFYGAAGNQHGDNLLRLSRTLVEAGIVAADDWTGTLVHEFGHFGISGHRSNSALMRAELESGGDLPWTVDAEAAEEWCDQQGC